MQENDQPWNHLPRLRVPLLRLWLKPSQHIVMESNNLSLFAQAWLDFERRLKLRDFFSFRQSSNNFFWFLKQIQSFILRFYFCQLTLFSARFFFREPAQSTFFGRKSSVENFFSLIRTRRKKSQSIEISWMATYREICLIWPEEFLKSFRRAKWTWATRAMMFILAK